MYLWLHSGPSAASGPRLLAVCAPESRRGGMLVWVVVALGVLVGVLALGVDGGRMMEERRRAQTAADAAALAAGNDLYENYYPNQGTDPEGTAQAAALQAAAANGYANDGTRSIVTVNCPPQSGQFAGRAEYVEVIVQSNLPGTFSKVFTGDPVVRARAVARGRPKPLGVLSLSGSASPAVFLTGNSALTVRKAPMQIDSSASAALKVTPGSTITAPTIEVLSSVLGGLLGLLGSLLGQVTTLPAPVPDPLLNMPIPQACDYPQRCGSQLVIGAGTVTLQPGTYKGGISITNSAQVTLQPGVYVMDGGGFVVSVNAALTANNVFLFNGSGGNTGPISLTSTGPVTWTAPTSGPWTGVAMAQDRSSSKGLQMGGSGSLNVQGAVYAPAASVQISGNGLLGGKNGACSGFIVSTLTLNGNANLTVDPGAIRPKVPDVRLVE